MGHRLWNVLEPVGSDISPLDQEPLFVDDVEYLVTAQVKSRPEIFQYSGDREIDADFTEGLLIIDQTKDPEQRKRQNIYDYGLLTEEKSIKNYSAALKKIGFLCLG